MDGSWYVSFWIRSESMSSCIFFMSQWIASIDIPKSLRDSSSIWMLSLINATFPESSANKFIPIRDSIRDTFISIIPNRVSSRNMIKETHSPFLFFFMKISDLLNPSFPMHGMFSNQPRPSLIDERFINWSCSIILRACFIFTACCLKPKFN